MDIYIYIYIHTSSSQALAASRDLGTHGQRTGFQTDVG